MQVLSFLNPGLQSQAFVRDGGETVQRCIIVLSPQGKDRDKKQDKDKAMFH
jgi:hypothetical protein